jgi:hypothetical protein
MKIAAGFRGGWPPTVDGVSSTVGEDAPDERSCQDWEMPSERVRLRQRALGRM